MGFWKMLVGSDPAVSSTRIMSIFLVVVGVGIAVSGVVKWWIYGGELAGVTALVSSLIGFGVAGKAVQNVLN